MKSDTSSASTPHSFRTTATDLSLALCLGCAAIWLVESLYLAFGLAAVPEAILEFGRLRFFSGLVAVTGVTFLVHTVPVAVGTAWLRDKTSYWWILPLICAGTFGFFWQETIIHGDGLVARSDYQLIRIASAVLAPLGVAGVAGLMLRHPRQHASIEPLDLPIMALIGAATYFNATILPGYAEFHAYLAVFIGLSVAWFFWPMLERPAFRRTASAFGALVLVTTAFTVANSPQLLRYVQRFGHTPQAMLSDLPASLAYGDALSLDTSPPELTDEEVRALLPPPPNPQHYDEPHGDNILFVVLESTRSDTWADSKVTPSFQAWRSHGTYFSRAVAQYPATPLAYGAMFTSQPPEVLIRSPYWARSKPFKPVLAQFDRVIATRPDISWFDTNAIREFFLPEAVQPNRHSEAAEGLDFLKQRLSDQREDSFFAWAHLYEPHQPWERREGFASGEGKAAAYRSEVALVDDRLGKFMRWFYAQPFADNTLVVVVSDHGEGLGEVIQGAPYWGHHVHVRNVVSHVPLYVSGPGLPRGEVVEASAASQMDLLPTFYDFVGLQPADDLLIQGRSLYQVVENPEPRPLVTQAFSFRGHAFFDFVNRAKDMPPAEIDDALEETVATSAGYPPKTAIQYGSYKIVRDEWLGTSKVYAVDSDHEESRELSETKPDAARELVERLDRWKRQQRAVIQTLNDDLTSR
jgi:hypothetical protein